MNAPPDEDLVNAGKSPTEFNRWRRSRGIVMQRTEANGRATLVLGRPFLTPFSTEHASRIAPFNPFEGIVIRRLRLEGTGHHLDGVTDDEWTSAERALNSDIMIVRLRRVAESFIHDLEIFHFRSQGVNVNDTVDVQVFENDIHDSTDYDGGGRGYGLTGVSSQGLTFYSNHLTGVMRHSLAFTNGTFDSSMVDNVMERAEVPHPDMWACIEL